MRPRLPLVLLAAGSSTTSANAANPIRRIVTLLQDMEKELQNEVTEERKMYAKYECYCKQNDGALSSQAAEAMAERDKQSQIEEQKKGEKKRLAEELIQHKKDREAAKKVLAVTIETEKERVKAFEAEHSEYLDTIRAMEAAIKALSKGMGKTAFLQSAVASKLKKVMQSPLLSQSSYNQLHQDEDNQRAVFSFLNKDYAPASGEIVGILKQMLDQMNEDMGGALEEDKKAKATYHQMKTAKEQEIAALSQMIEEKTELKGKVGVEIVQAMKAKEDAIAQLGDAQAFLVKLKEMCGDKKDEFAIRADDAQKEISAIQEAVVVLNGDDSLDIFKKADPRALLLQQPSDSNKVSFLQKGTSLQAQSFTVKKLVQMLDSLIAKSRANKSMNKALSLLALTAKSELKQQSKSKAGVDFSKVITMIDEMVELLKSEAANDLHSRDDCNADLTMNEADTKETKHKLTAEQEKVAEMTELIAAKAKLIEENTANIAESKKAVQEATAQREKENAQFITTVDLNNSAIQLIDKAINVLNKYYNPQLYKAPKEKELTEEEKILQAEGQDIGETTVTSKIAGTDIDAVLLQKQHASSSFLQIQSRQVVDPTESAPEIFESAQRKNKSGKSNSVVALLRMLQSDIKKDSAAVESDEKVAEKDYVGLTTDAFKQQAEWGKSIADATSDKASYEEELQKAETMASVNELELENLATTLQELHVKCDFIIAHFEERKAARESEIDGLHQAKGVLAGASFEF
ncbi:unnamed protein product [Amoebophrya sp. A120]|nr:unnamed protein product [Amoebophrya sp. A120]|eukprot:GSA120T00013806001.1